MRITKFNLLGAVLLFLVFIIGVLVGKKVIPQYNQIKKTEGAKLEKSDFLKATALLPTGITITGAQKLSGHFFWFGAEKRFPVEREGAFDKSEFQSWLVDLEKHEAQLAKNYIPGAPLTEVNTRYEGENGFLVVTTRNDWISDRLKGWIDDYFDSSGYVLSVWWTRDNNEGQFIELDDGHKKTKIQFAPVGVCNGVQPKDSKKVIVTGLFLNEKEFQFDKPYEVECFLGFGNENYWIKDPRVVRNDEMGELELWFRLPWGENVIVSDLLDKPYIRYIGQ